MLIIIDTCRADHFGCYGYKRNTTPNIDKFAEESAVFEQAYSHSPWTMPSIASVFTSLHPKDHGIVKWVNPLDLKVLTIAEHLRVQGFHTEGYASHVVFERKYGFSQGFERYSISPTQKGDINSITTSKEITDLGIEAIDRPMKTPFFLWLHYFDPHFKYIQHEQFKFGLREIDRYDSEIAFTDHHIGRFLDRLRKTGLLEKTMVVITTDHGEEFQDHGGKSHAHTLYDELIRVALIIHAPGIVHSRVKRIVTQSDIAPTICAQAQVPIPDVFKGKSIHRFGRRYSPLFDRTVYSETYRKADKRGVRKKRWKLIHDRENEQFELYNLINDPLEKRNRVAIKPKKTAELKALLKKYYQSGERKATEQKMSPDLKEKLESLGYL